MKGFVLILLLAISGYGQKQKLPSPPKPVVPSPVLVCKDSPLRGPSLMMADAQPSGDGLKQGKCPRLIWGTPMKLMKGGYCVNATPPQPPVVCQTGEKTSASHK